MTDNKVIKALEKRLNGITQKQLALELGISQAYLCDILAGKRGTKRIAIKLGLREEVNYKKIK